MLSEACSQFEKFTYYAAWHYFAMEDDAHTRIFDRKTDALV